jgi:hypothetical protein
MLPLNPDGIAGMEPTLAFNTISSFTTNTNLQHYSGETGLSYLSQMIVISFLQFVTAATGVAAGIATIRALAGNRLAHLGNFYVDVTRATVRLFLPLALLVSVLVMSQGTPMTFEGRVTATTLEGHGKPSRGVLPPPSYRSSSSARTVVATSARTPRIHTRTRRRCLLRRNLLIYGVGGVLLPFAGIKVIDVVLVAVGLA